MPDDWYIEEPLWYITRGRRVEIPFSLIKGRAIKRVGTTGIAVYIILLWCKNDKTGLCYPSRRTISRYTGLNGERIRRALTRLEEEGLIAITKRKRTRPDGTEYGQVRNYYEL